MMMYTSCKYNYYLCYFLEIIDNKKIEKSDVLYDNVYILHVKKYDIRTCTELGR
jgi:hypothetical protein